MLLLHTDHVPVNMLVGLFIVIAASYNKSILSSKSWPADELFPLGNRNFQQTLQIICNLIVAWVLASTVVFVAWR